MGKSVIVGSGGNFAEVSQNGELSVKGDVGILSIPSLPNGSNNIGTINSLRSNSEIEVLNSLSRTVDGNSSTIDVGNFREFVAFLDVTNVVGTSPTLDVKFQVQDPVSLKWFDIQGLSFTQKTAISNELISKDGLVGKNIRCVYSLGGTSPDFTFSVGLLLKS